MRIYRIVFYSLVFLFVCTRISHAAEQPKSLDAAVQEIKHMISHRYNRYDIAERVMNIADTQIRNNNSPERMLNPENIFSYFKDSEADKDFFEWRESGGAYKQYDETAEWAWNRRTGQCGENSALVYYILKKAGAKDVRLFESSGHAYTVWGLDSEDDPAKRHNWTDDVIVPDSWQGMTLRGREAFNNKYCSGGRDVTHERDSSAQPRCGIIDRGVGIIKAPACPFPPECRGNKLAIHIGDSCYSCGHQNEYCCENNWCLGRLECSNSVCVPISTSDNTPNNDDKNKKMKTCRELQSNFDTAIENKKYHTAGTFFSLAHDCQWVKDNQDSDEKAMDNDQDGVNDPDDQCPKTPTGMLVDNTGCSASQRDSDKDSVKDDTDSCPNTPAGEKVDEKGCSDSQRDGDKDTISDATDTCPDTPRGETVDAKGCSDSQLDSDKDTISDAADTCPDTPRGETVDAKGCSDSQLDSDKDTISDATDTCPDTLRGETVDAKGCSESQLAELNRKKKCPGGTVKLSDDSGINHCVPCSDLKGEFDTAISEDDREYAGFLLNLSPDCGWAATGRKNLDQAKSCPENTVKLSDENGNNQCVPCSELQGDYIAAQTSGDEDYAGTLIDLSGSCGWAQSVTKQLGYDAMMADLDQRCQEQLLFSHAVISGDRYNCVCDDGLIIITRSGSSACQNCEQLRGALNSALQRNDIGSARGLMNGAQICGWYNEAVQVVANAERNKKRKEAEQLQNFVNGITGLTGILLDEYNRNKGHTTTHIKEPPKRRKKKIRKNVSHTKKTHRQHSGKFVCPPGENCGSLEPFRRRQME